MSVQVRYQGLENEPVPLVDPRLWRRADIVAVLNEAIRKWPGDVDAKLPLHASSTGDAEDVRSHTVITITDGDGRHADVEFGLLAPQQGWLKTEVQPAIEQFNAQWAK